MLGRFFKKEDESDNLDQDENDPRARAAEGANPTHGTTSEADDDESRLSFMNTDDDGTVDTTNSGLLLDKVKSSFLSDLQAEDDAPSQEANNDAASNEDEDSDNSQGYGEGEPSQKEVTGGKWGGWAARRASLTPFSRRPSQANSEANNEANNKDDQPEKSQGHEDEDETPQEDAVGGKWGGWTARRTSMARRESANGNTEQQADGGSSDVATPETPRQRKWGWSGGKENEESSAPDSEETNETNGSDEGKRTADDSKGSSLNDSKSSSLNEGSATTEELETPRRRKWGWSAAKTLAEQSAPPADAGDEKDQSAKPDSKEKTNEDDDDSGNPVVSAVQTRYLGGWNRRGSTKGDREESESQDEGSGSHSGSTKTDDLVTPRTAARRWGWAKQQQQKQQEQQQNEGAKAQDSPPQTPSQTRRWGWGAKNAEGSERDDENNVQRLNDSGKSLNNNDLSHGASESDLPDGPSSPSGDYSLESESDPNIRHDSEPTSGGGKEEENSTPEKRFSWMSKPGREKAESDKNNEHEDSESEEETYSLEEENNEDTEPANKAARPSIADTKSDAGSWFGTSVASIFSTGEVESDELENAKDGAAGSWFGGGLLAQESVPDSSAKEAETSRDKRADLKRSPSWLESVMGEIDSKDEPRDTRPELVRTQSWLGSVLGETDKNENEATVKEPEATATTTPTTSSWLASVMGESTAKSGEPPVSNDVSITETKDRRQELKRSQSWLESLMGEDGETPKSPDEQEGSAAPDRRAGVTRSASWIESVIGQSAEVKPSSQIEEPRAQPLSASSTPSGAEEVKQSSQIEEPRAQPLSASSTPSGAEEVKPSSQIEEPRAQPLSASSTPSGAEKDGLAPIVGGTIAGDGNTANPKEEAVCMPHTPELPAPSKADAAPQHKRSIGASFSSKAQVAQAPPSPSRETGSTHQEEEEDAPLFIGEKDSAERAGKGGKSDLRLQPGSQNVEGSTSHPPSKDINLQKLEEVSAQPAVSEQRTLVDSPVLAETRKPIEADPTSAPAETPENVSQGRFCLRELPEEVVPSRPKGESLQRTASIRRKSSLCSDTESPTGQQTHQVNYVPIELRDKGETNTDEGSKRKGVVEVGQHTAKAGDRTAPTEGSIIHSESDHDGSKSIDSPGDYSLGSETEFSGRGPDQPSSMGFTDAGSTGGDPLPSHWNLANRTSSSDCQPHSELNKNADENTNETTSALDDEKVQEDTDHRSTVKRNDSWLGAILGESDQTGKDTTAVPEVASVQACADRRSAMKRSDSWLGAILGESDETTKEIASAPEGQIVQENADRNSAIKRSDSWLGSILGDSDETATEAANVAEDKKVQKVDERRSAMARSDSWLGSIMGDSDETATDAANVAEDKKVQEADDRRSAMTRSDSWLGSIMGDNGENPPPAQPDDRRSELARSDSWLGSILGDAGHNPPQPENIQTGDPSPPLARSDSWLGSILGESAVESKPQSEPNEHEVGKPQSSSMGNKLDQDPSSSDDSESDSPSQKDRKEDSDATKELRREKSWYDSVFGDEEQSKDNKETGTTDHSPTRDPEAVQNIGEETESSAGDGAEQPKREKSWLESVFGEEEEAGKMKELEVSKGNPSGGPESSAKPVPNRRAGLQRSNSWLESVLAEGADPTSSDFQANDEIKDRRGQLKKSKSWLESMLESEEKEEHVVDQAKPSSKPAVADLRSELKRSQSWFESKDIPPVPVSPEADEPITGGLFHNPEEHDISETEDERRETHENDAYVSRFDGLRKLSLFRALDGESYKTAKSETTLRAPTVKRDHGSNRLLALAKAILGDELEQQDGELWLEDEIAEDLDMPDYLQDPKNEDSESPSKQKEAGQNLDPKTNISSGTNSGTNDATDKNDKDSVGRQRWAKWFRGAKPDQSQEPEEQIDVEDDQLESSASEVSESDPSLSTGVLESDVIIEETADPPIATAATECRDNEVIDATNEEEPKAQKAEPSKEETGKAPQSTTLESDAPVGDPPLGDGPQTEPRKADANRNDASLEQTKELIESLTPEEVDLIADKVINELRQDATIPPPTQPAPSNTTRRRKKGSIGALLDQIPSGKVGRHGDEVSVGVMNLRKAPAPRTSRDVVVPKVNYQCDEHSTMGTGKKHPWENALQKGDKKSSFSGENPDEEENLKQIEILGKADEYFGLRPNVNSNKLPALNEEEATDSEESDEDEEDNDEIAALGEKSDLELQLEQDKGVGGDFEEMWDNVSCDEEIATEFYRNKRKKNHEREKRRQRLEREKEENFEANRRLRLFEKTDRSAPHKRAKNGKNMKLSEELVEALQKVFDEGSENSFGSRSDDDDSDDGLGGSGNNGSCNSLYLDEKESSESRSKSEHSIDEEVMAVKRADGRSKPMFARVLVKDVETKAPKSPASKSQTKTKKASKKAPKVGGKKRSKRSETDASEIFMKEIQKLKQPKGITIESLRQEMIDRRGTTVNLLKKEYVTFRKKRNDKKDLPGEEADEVRPLDFAALTARRSITQGQNDGIFDGGSPTKPKEASSVGIGEMLSRWASEEGVSDLDDLATVNEQPTTVTNMFGVIQPAAKPSALAPPLRIPNTPKGPSTYGSSGLNVSPAKVGPTRETARQVGSTRNLTRNASPQNSPVVRRDPQTHREPKLAPEESAQMNMFTANFGVTESVQEASDHDEDFGLLARRGSDDNSEDDDDDRSYFSSASRHSARSGSKHKRKKGLNGLGKNLKKFASKMPSMRAGRGRNSGAGMMLTDNDW